MEPWGGPGDSEECADHTQTTPTPAQKHCEAQRI